MMGLAGVFLLASVALNNSSGPILLALPRAMLAGYFALLVMVVVVRPKWRKCPLFLWSVGAPLFGPMFAFLVLLADWRKPK